MKAAPTVQPLLTFGQCLKNILGARKLSASALSRMMEQKSRNSMFRILDDTGGPAVQAAFFESLKASDCLHLTEQEERELERALEVSRFGVAGYMTNQAMHRLLGDVDLQAAADDSLRVDRSRDGSVTTLRESMERLAAEQKRVHFVITGCCYRRVLERIAAAFAGSACEMSIEHYLYTGGGDHRLRIRHSASALSARLQGLLHRRKHVQHPAGAGLPLQHDHRALRGHAGAKAGAHGGDDRPAAAALHRLSG